MQKYFGIGSCSRLSALLKCCVLVTLLSCEWEDVLLKSSLARQYWISWIFDISIWKTKMFMESSYQISRKLFYNWKLSNTLDSIPQAAFTVQWQQAGSEVIFSPFDPRICQQPGRANKQASLATTGSARIMYAGRGGREGEGISYKLYFDNPQVGYQGQISYLFQ